jgi:uncharacterized protein
MSSSTPEEPSRPSPEPMPPTPHPTTGPDATAAAGGQGSPTPQPAPGYTAPTSPAPAPGPSYGPPAAPSYTGQIQPMSAADERTWGMFAHLAPFVGALVGLPFLGPLVVFLIYKDRSPFVRRHAVESLNFQLTLLIGYVISAVLMLVIIGFFTAAAIAIASIVLQILAAVAANRGEDYRYPLTIRFVH